MILFLLLLAIKDERVINFFLVATLKLMFSCQLKIYSKFSALSRGEK